MSRWPYSRGLHELSAGTFAYTQPEGSWGWSNAGLVVDGDTSVLVDTLFDVPLTAQMLKLMRDATPAAAHIQTLVNTHANGDHCWGNQLVEGARIIASRRGAEEMAEVNPALMAKLMKVAAVVTAAGPVGRGLGAALGALGLHKIKALADAAPFVHEIFGGFDFGSVAVTPPTETFDGTLDVPVGDRVVQLIEVGPAHTTGDVIVWVPDSRTVFSGDILFIEGHPIMWEGPIGNWIAACDRIIALNPEVVVPGHGQITDVKGVQQVRDYLVYIRDQARLRYDAGLSVFDAAVDIDLSAYASWSDDERIVINVQTLYREFSGQGSKGDVLEAFGLMARARKAMHP